MCLNFIWYGDYWEKVGVCNTELPNNKIHKIKKLRFFLFLFFKKRKLFSICKETKLIIVRQVNGSGCYYYNINSSLFFFFLFFPHLEHFFFFTVNTIFSSAIVNALGFLLLTNS